ncbi:penicillin-binding protein 1A [Hephaestia sp. GCM10023244]|uniref:penicillin-binding protein 1A n=1 Tax=unclassified Hephaestia TaxID=2631281 RepID=UPI0020771173|nr:transglycosylase domain-containing protein [Hephaestia sp. MAHUQ-44]MCM8729408.1 transglycosylase domain-containing protein [Hephaestia sp. MAHUQ-44]
MAGTETSMQLKLRREVEGVGGFIKRVWSRWWGKALVLLVGLGLLGLFLIWLLFARGLPSVDTLRAYEPPLPTYVRGINGEPIHSYARERRIELSYEEYPPLLVKAFLAAEDRTFFQHHGVDLAGIAKAAWTNLTRSGRPIGASTITQQVAKNLLIGNEASYTRKAKEAILAWRIEQALTKQQILELYLNQIFLGRNAYGVEAAAHAYYGKPLDQLDLAQFAYLAILPKGPANYDPERDRDAALARRHYVLKGMLSNGFIDQAQYARADAEPLGTVRQRLQKFDRVGGYFIEAVRRELIDRFGEQTRDGPHSVYAGGLWVRTSLDPRLQGYAQKALRDGLIRYDRGRGWSGPIRHVEVENGGWQSALLLSNIGLDYEDWQAAIVSGVAGGSASLVFANGSTGNLPRDNATMPVRDKGGTAFAALKPGDIIAVAPSGAAWSLRSIPMISGGMVVQEPATGRILAMQGGFDSRVQSFNRATQAMRQPGSTIKPIVYSAALEQGMTPASIIVDGPFCVYQGARLGQKCFRNFGGGSGAGPHTMRWGIEQSRNLMTVRAAAQTGMPHVVDLAKRMGVGDYEPYLSMALGAGETTVERMVNAFSVLANQGKWHDPTLIDFVQDRHGKVIWPANWRACTGCNAPDWNGKPMPRPQIRARQAIDPLTAFQMVHITEGVVQRGTATTLRDLGRPMMGKTGTTTGPTDVWFIGGTPQMIGGLYLGYDNPRRLGGYAQGGTIAAPIFKAFAEKAYKDLPVEPFRAPPGIRMVRIDRRSGKPVFGAWPTNEPLSPVIWEAFKPESEPRRTIKRDETIVEKPKEAAPVAPPRDSDFLQREGGIY